MCRHKAKLKILIPLLIAVSVMPLQACANTPAPQQEETESQPAVVFEPETTPTPNTETNPEPETTDTPATEPETETETNTGTEPDTTPEEEPGVPEVGYLAPNFQMQNPDGSTFSLRDFGKPVVLNFWNTGCPHCVNEMPILEEVYNEKSADGLILLTINIAESMEAVKEFLDNNKIQIPVLLDTNASIAREYLVQYLPTTFFINPEGVIQDKKVGAFRSKIDFENHLESIMP